MTSISAFRRFVHASRIAPGRGRRMCPRLRLLALDDVTLGALRQAVLDDPLGTAPEWRERVARVTLDECRAMAVVLLGTRRPHRRWGDGRSGRASSTVDEQAARVASALWSIPARIRAQLEQEPAEIRRRAMAEWQRRAMG